ncbi:MAG: cupin [Arthrospira sp. SH-MAG29]|nr:cupin [Arthrospira sp. SH-MAG29]MBS0016870.1 cupin [Arthrospira sp. SH-MAG29]
MTDENWLATNDGRCKAVDWTTQEESLSNPYRLYRFLTNLEDIVANISEDYLRLEAICPLVRQLLNSSSWLQIPMLEPNPETGWEVLMLYDEPFFPLTVQLVAWAPGTVSPIHNHGCWGLVALLSGKEKNSFWRRSPTAEFPDKIELMDEREIMAGDILCFLPDAIHKIEAISPEPTISFNLYGETNYNQRFEFDPVKFMAQTF